MAATRAERRAAKAKANPVEAALEDDRKAAAAVDEAEVKKAVLEQMRASGQQPDHVPASMLRDMVRQIVDELKADGQVMRASSKPFEPEYFLTPDNYDVCAEARKAAEAKGHRLSKFEVAVEGVSDFWHAQCLNPIPTEPGQPPKICGAMAHARWLPPPTNDQRHFPAGTPRPKKPIFFGTAVSEDESKMHRKPRKERQFVPEDTAVGA